MQRWSAKEGYGVNDIVDRWNVLRVRKVFHCNRNYTFGSLIGIHPIVTVSAVDIEIGSLLYVEAVELLKLALETHLNLTRQEIQALGWEGATFTKMPNVQLNSGELRSYVNLRNKISHEGEVIESPKDLEVLLDRLATLLCQFGIISSKPDYNQLVWYFDRNKEPTPEGKHFAINGSFGVQIAKTSKKVYYYTFKILYGDPEMQFKKFESWSKLNIDLSTL